MKGKEEWLEKEYTEVERSLSMNNNRKAFEILKELTKQRQLQGQHHMR